MQCSFYHILAMYSNSEIKSRLTIHSEDHCIINNVIQFYHEEKYRKFSHNNIINVLSVIVLVISPLFLLLLVLLRHQQHSTLPLTG